MYYAAGSTMFMTFYQNRNSKLESHLKRLLPRYVYDDIRYYESCVVKEPKAALEFKYVILTGKAILLAAYPLRGVKEVIRLSDILNITVEHDYPPFLKGSEGHNCQHIRVRHVCRGTDNKLGELKDVREEEGEMGESGRDEIDDPDDSDQKQDKERNNADDFLEKITSNVSLRQIREKEITSDSSRIPPGRQSSANFVVSSRMPCPKISHDCEWEERQESCSPSSLSNFPVQCEPIQDFAESIGDCTPSKKTTEQRNSELKTSKDFGITKLKSTTPRRQGISLSSLLSRVQYDKPRPSRSLSSMDQHQSLLSPFPNAPEEKRSQSVMDKPRKIADVRAIEDGTAKILIRGSNDIHIYVLHSKPVLLNHLQMSWCAHLLNKTRLISKEFKAYISTSNTCDIFCLENLYYQFKNEIISSVNNPDEMISLLEELIVGFHERPELKSIFWKDQVLYQFMVQQLEKFMLSSKFRCSTSHDTYRDEIDVDLMIECRQKELKISLLLLDALSLVFHESDNIGDKLQMLQFHNGNFLRHLISTVMSSPFIPPKFQNTCSRMLEDFSEFSTYAWKNLPEGEVINLMAAITNAVGAILAELIITIRRLTDNNPGITISLIFQDISLEYYLKRSITQLLGLLFPSHHKNLKPEESVLIYQHFFVLKNLMENIAQVRCYIKENYEEEFRYYVQWSRINSKIPEKYPIKCVLQPLVEYVHKMGVRQSLKTKALFS